MSLSELPNELSERGIWWQVGGFAIAGCASVAVLQIWEGSDFWAYRSFEIAVKDLYWMFVLPLAGLFEGVRKMFEKASEIRAAQREKMLRKARAKGRKEGHTEGRTEGRREGHTEGRKEGREEALAGVRSRLQSAAIKKDQATGTITLSPEDLEYLLGERDEAAGR